MRVFFVLLLGGALAMSLARNASAQTSTGSIRGYVTDSSGTPVAAAGVEAQTSEVATSVTPQQMRALPSASHNFLDLAALAPGVTVAPDFANLGVANAGVTDKAFSYGGQGPGQVNVFIDGASLKNDLTGGESGIHGGTFGQDASRGNPFPRDAVQEYRVITQNFKAEYQQSSGAIKIGRAHV